MKKKYLLLIVLLFLLTSCSPGGMNMRFIEDDQDTKDTFKQVFNAIQQQDETALKKLFSKRVRDEVSDLDERTANFLDFFQGEVISFDDLTAAGTSTTIEHGKKQMEIKSFYDVNTSEQKYHIAIKECTVDDFDADNVGVISVYVINTEDWTETFDYGGDGKWTPGIVIDQKKE